MSDLEARRERLERVVNQALAGQPPRRAPATLGDRVMTELARRAALPWWSRGFGYWPLGARVAFVAALALLLWLVLGFTGGATAGVDAAVRSNVGQLSASWAASLHALGAVSAELGALAARTVPAAWAYGFAAVIAALYVSFFGLGAATYRLLQTRG